jgi:subtilisin family serine protease
VPNAPASVALTGIEWVELNLAVSLDPIVLNGILQIPGTGAADWYRQQPAWKIIRANEASSRSSGRGVVVADINSAVDTSHPALAGHLINGHDFVASRRGEAIDMDQSSASFMDQSSASFMDQSSASFLDQSSASFMDQSSASFMDATRAAYGHGTPCAGIIAGIAPQSMIMPIRVFDEKGEADLFTIAKAIRYAARNGAQVINMSFGTLAPSNALKGAIEFAIRAGATLVASAGNRNTNQPQYPAAYRGVIAVAATDLRDVKASFSNYGKSVFTDAPGVHIISSYPSGTYAVSSGTSFSAPTVAGAAALVRSGKAVRIAESIARGSVNIDGKNPNYARQLGYGRVDVLSVVQSK